MCIFWCKTEVVVPADPLELFHTDFLDPVVADATGWEMMGSLCKIDVMLLLRVECSFLFDWGYM